MDAFSRLSRRLQILVLSVGALLVSLSVGLLVFGENVVSAENHFIHQAKEATRADMLYIHPEMGH